MHQVGFHYTDVVSILPRKIRTLTCETDTFPNEQFCKTCNSEIKKLPHLVRKWWQPQLIRRRPTLLWSLRVMQIIHKYSTSVLQESNTISVTKTSQLIMFREIAVFFCENHSKWRVVHRFTTLVWKDVYTFHFIWTIQRVANYDCNFCHQSMNQQINQQFLTDCTHIFKLCP